MLTIAETALTVAGIGVGGTTLGGYLAARAGRQASLQAARQQRRLEADRRRDDRRAALYHEVLRSMQLLTRDQARHVLSGRRDRRHDENSEAAETRANLSSRLALFASGDVGRLFQAWLDVFAERWFENVAEDQQQRLEAAREALVAQMRRELEEFRD